MKEHNSENGKKGEITISQLFGGLLAVVVIAFIFNSEFRQKCLNMIGEKNSSYTLGSASKLQAARSQPDIKEGTQTHKTEQGGNENADPTKSRKNDMLWGAYLSSLPRIYGAFTVINDGISSSVDFTTYSAQVVVLNNSLADFKDNSPDPRLFTDADYLSISSIVNDRIYKAAMACNAAHKVWNYKIIRDNSDSLDEYSKQYPYIDEVYNSIAQVYPSIESAIIPPSFPSEGRRYSMEGILAIVMHETSGGINVVLNDFNKLIGNE